jgi:hypothetical protein
LGYSPPGAAGAGDGLRGHWQDAAGRNGEAAEEGVRSAIEELEHLSEAEKDAFVDQVLDEMESD